MTSNASCAWSAADERHAATLTTVSKEAREERSRRRARHAALAAVWLVAPSFGCATAEDPGLPASASAPVDAAETPPDAARPTDAPERGPAESAPIDPPLADAEAPAADAVPEAIAPPTPPATTPCRHCKGQCKDFMQDAACRAKCIESGSFACTVDPAAIDPCSCS
jgi:hypothetical protein